MSEEQEFIARDDAKHGVFGELERRYARALFKVATDQDNVRDVFASVRELQKAIEEHSELRYFLMDKRFDNASARDAITAIVEKLGVVKSVENFVALIAQNGRLSYLENILTAFVVEVVSSLNQVVAEVVSAVALTQEQKETIRARLSDGERRVVLHTHVDPSLFGGFVVRVGDRLYDASLRARLLRLHYAMKGAA